MSVGQLDQPQPESNGGHSQTQPSEPESRLTIIQAIQQVMAQSGHPMTIPQVYEAIVRNHLYQFKADDPAHIVRNEIRRHCVGLDFASASPRKVFKFTGDGRYFVLASPVLDKGHGRARGLDHQRWPNAYFAELGLFSLAIARAQAIQSRKRTH